MFPGELEHSAYGIVLTPPVECTSPGYLRSPQLLVVGAGSGTFRTGPSDELGL